MREGTVPKRTPTALGHKASGQGSVLDDDFAHRVFDNYCGQTFARAFSLYKLYGQASGFAGQTP